MITNARGPATTVGYFDSDNFNRSALGPTWTINAGNPAIIASTDIGASAFSGVHITTSTRALTPNQYCEASVASGKVFNMLPQIWVRRRTSDGARYAFHWDDETGGESPAGAWALKYDGVASNLTVLLNQNFTVAAPVANTRMSVEARGVGATVNIKGFVNGILTCEANDTATDRIVAGDAGITFRCWVGATLTYPTPVFTDWSGGTLL